MIFHYKGRQIKTLLLWSAITLQLVIFTQTTLATNMKNIYNYSTQLSDLKNMNVSFLKF